LLNSIQQNWLFNNVTNMPGCRNALFPLGEYERRRAQHNMLAALHPHDPTAPAHAPAPAPAPLQLTITIMIAESQPESESESGSGSESEIVADTPPALPIAPAHAPLHPPPAVIEPNSPLTPLSYDETSESDSDVAPPSPSPPPSPPSSPPVPPDYFLSWNGRTGGAFMWHKY
jgi:hypothetical protein